MEMKEWIFYPICGNNTRIKVRYDTVLENFPLFCPKCKQETLINVKQRNMSVIIPKGKAWEWANSRKGYARCVSTFLCTAITNQILKKRGLVSLLDQYQLKHI